MRFLSVFRKSMIEQGRNTVTLLLSLVFAPFFVFLYWLFFYGGSMTYTVLVINDDVGAVLADGTSYNAGEEAAEAINGVRYTSGDPMLVTKEVSGRAEAEAILRDRGAVAFVQFPADFSRTILDARTDGVLNATDLVFGGDLTSPYYVVAAILATSAVDAYIQQASGVIYPVQYVEEPLGASGTRSEFELYVPGIFVFAVILMVFMASMVIAREVEAGTLQRLKITPMTSFDLLGGISASLMITSVLAVVLTFLTALALDFHSQGPIWVAMLVGAILSLSIIGAGLIVGSLAKTVAQAFIIANFPLGLFMFLSGAVFPLPGRTLFTLAGHEICVYDILPPTHAVVALNKVLTLGADLGDVTYEIGALVVLSVLYFAAGVWLFSRTHLRRT
jgi:ABC-2 type transport system permease protein